MCLWIAICLMIHIVSFVDLIAFAYKPNIQGKKKIQVVVLMSYQNVVVDLFVKFTDIYIRPELR